MAISYSKGTVPDVGFPSRQVKTEAAVELGRYLVCVLSVWEVMWTWMWSYRRMVEHSR